MNFVGQKCNEILHTDCLIAIEFEGIGRFQQFLHCLITRTMYRKRNFGFQIFDLHDFSIFRFSISVIVSLLKCKM